MCRPQPFIKPLGYHFGRSFKYPARASHSSCGTYLLIAVSIDMPIPVACQKPRQNPAKVGAKSGKKKRTVNSFFNGIKGITLFVAESNVGYIRSINRAFLKRYWQHTAVPATCRYITSTLHSTTLRPPRGERATKEMETYGKRYTSARNCPRRKKARVPDSNISNTLCCKMTRFHLS